MFFCFLMIRRPPRSTQSRSSAASDVYKRQVLDRVDLVVRVPALEVAMLDRVDQAESSSGVRARVEAACEYRRIRESLNGDSPDWGGAGETGKHHPNQDYH